MFVAEITHIITVVVCVSRALNVRRLERMYAKLLPEKYEFIFPKVGTNQVK